MLQEFALYYVIGGLIIIGLLAICSITFMIKNAKNNMLLTQQNKQLQKLLNENNRLNQQQDSFISENSRLKAEAAALQKYTEEKMRFIEQTQNDMAVKFRNISHEILTSQSQQINETQASTLSAVLNPFREQLRNFREEVNKANTENIKSKISFDEQFKILLNLNQNLSTEAQNLTEALRGSKKMQGDWGELELNRLLEISGLQKDIDYYTQINFKNDNNQNVRPDVIVKLPNARSVIIDAKVSMNDYVSYINEKDEDARSNLLLKHVQCIKSHIDELSAKEYQKLLKDESLDYVVLFIPIESAFAAAVKKDSTLFDYAYKKNIALATPSSLLPILRVVENLWQIENRNKYVQKIAEIGGSLYDKLANFTDDMQRVEKSLSTAQQSYEQAFSKLSTGKGNALSLAAKLKDYGAKTNKIIAIDFEDHSSELLEISENSNRKVS